MKRLKIGFLALAAGVALAASVSLPAHAAGIVTVWSHGVGGSTSLQTYDSGLYVGTASVRHMDTPTFFNYCNFRGKTWGTKSTGTNATWYSSTYYGCSPLPYSNATYPSTNLKHNTYLKGQSYHDNAWAPGVPQIKILN